jgi:protein tyrosine phosphatase (PTP) superfamily phosphohydrolase (DUF442 family)
MNRTVRVVCIAWPLALLVPLGLAAGAAEAADPELRPAIWAQPVAVEGAPNLHRVSPTLYRCAQPSAQGLSNVAALGVKAVVSLRAFHGESDEAEAAGLTYLRISFKTWHAEDEDVVQFLRFVCDPAHQPALVHCLHGADRTGTMCAVYRVVVDRWTVEQAIDEMRRGGYGFHEVWDNLPAYLRGLDVPRLAQAGLDAPAP